MEMNREKNPPLRLRPKKMEIEVNKLFDRAANLLEEYHHMRLEKIMQMNIDNKEKVKNLLQLSTEPLPRLTGRPKHRTPKDKKYSKTNSKESPNKKVVESDNDDDLEKGQRQNSPNFEEFEKVIKHLVERDAKEEDIKFNSSKRSDKKSSVKNTSQPESRRSLCYSDVASDNKPQHSIRTMDEVMTLDSESSLSDNELDINDDKIEPGKTTEKQFRYDIEIKTGEEDSKPINSDIFLILNGETMTSTRKLNLRQYFKSNTCSVGPFYPGSLDYFELCLPEYIGDIKNIVIGLTSPTPDDSWFLEYICISDRTLAKDYRFPCRRWLGRHCADQLVVVTLGYTPSYHNDYQSLKSTSLEDTRNYQDAQLQFRQHSQFTLSNKTSLDQETISKDDVRLSGSQIDKKKSLSIAEDEKGLDFSQKQSLNLENESKINDKNDEILQNPISNGLNIHGAIRANQYDRVKELCSLDDTLKCLEDEDGNSPIHLAAIYYKDSQIIDYLISLNVDPNLKSKAGFTPFMLAVINGNSYSVKYLNEKIEINRNIRDNENNTAMHLATSHGHENIAKYLFLDIVEADVENQLRENPKFNAQKGADSNLINTLSKSTEISIDGSSMSDDDSYGIEFNKNEDMKQLKKEAIIIPESANDYVIAEPNPPEIGQEKDGKDFSNQIINDMQDENAKPVHSEEAQEHLQSSSLNEIKENVVNAEHSSQDKLTEEDFVSTQQTEEGEADKINTDKNLENIQPDSDRIIINSNKENDDDNRGILFKKRFPDEEDKLKLVKTNVDSGQPRNVRFDNSSSSESAVSGTSTSPISSRPSSSLTIGGSETDSELTIKRNSISNIDFHQVNHGNIDDMRENESKGIQETSENNQEENSEIAINLHKSNEDLVAKSLTGKSDGNQIRERDENANNEDEIKNDIIGMDSENPNDGATAINEIESQTVREIDKSSSAEHSV